MSLYAIGDLHLHYQSVLKAPGQLQDRVWKNHEEKLRKNCGKLITDEETVCCLYHQKKDFISVPYEPKNADYLKR